MNSFFSILKISSLLVFIILQTNCTNGQSTHEIQPGACQTSSYFPMLQGKRVAIVANHTATIDDVHLVDSLVRAGIEVKKVFSPEHGFRGIAEAGQKVDDAIDLVTGLPVLSLYGNNKKPRKEDLSDIDLIIFDIQDVGARFYTYISTMTYVMEACAEHGIPLIILDRPNPNGFYVDGPVLQPEFKSFVGLHPVPIVHGMTIGEYAQMVNGEGWLENELKCEIKIIPVKNYMHSDFYELPLRPSPNLPNKNAVYLYPSLCLFEGTVVSVGRGTELPFQVIGHPEFTKGNYYFVPKPMIGAVKPPFDNITCNGFNLTDWAQKMNENSAQINLDWLILFYNELSEKNQFFNSFFEKLAGTAELRKQIEQGLSAEQIRETWQPELKEYKRIRKKYLIYTDIE
ncbi:MAG: DUF1343 domain-containing protein [Bacteroidales bacterium]|jgi:uncharacterized protein YbbC (DUF1343 family)|nr:DUF1343 domain-containing protein [Bacteroidales bacterium]MDI9592247.1 DUF1343 domain-containing protein [Bacteroidota bacterium]NLH32882.1 DUF1343 domain-containing protein [Lentimicrobium sp.]OQC38507.1 MAG: hypothetical protein BWX63_00142 [Bacteroidetes bacterium ADurb.Bin041]MBP7873819.1 DUF1343 domain-containing protein [Bacteroidales bacterium]